MNSLIWIAIIVIAIILLLWWLGRQEPREEKRRETMQPAHPEPVDTGLPKVEEVITETPPEVAPAGMITEEPPAVTAEEVPAAIVGELPPVQAAPPEEEQVTVITQDAAPEVVQAAVAETPVVEETPAPEAPAAPTTPMPEAIIGTENPVEEAIQAEAPLKPDDLEIIEGIGPKIAGLLKEQGIVTFKQLAYTNVADLQKLMLAANLRIADPATWPEQAKLASEGRWDDLKTLQDTLKGGRRVD